MELKAKKTEYTITPDEIKNLIAEKLKVPVSSVTIDFRIGTKQLIGNPYDSGPDIKEVTEIKVTVTSK